MKQSSIYAEPDTPASSRSDEDPLADDARGSGPTVVHITNYYASGEKRKVHNNFVRGGTDGSVLY